MELSTHNRESVLVVGIATGYGLDDRGVEVRVPVGSRIFSTSSRVALGSTQPPLRWIQGALSPEIKRPGLEANHSPPTVAEVKQMWSYTSITHTPSWRSVWLVKHRDNFTFTVLLIALEVVWVIYRELTFALQSLSRHFTDWAIVARNFMTSDQSYIMWNSDIDSFFVVRFIVSLPLLRSLLHYVSVLYMFYQCIRSEFESMTLQKLANKIKLEGKGPRIIFPQIRFNGLRNASLAVPGFWAVYTTFFSCWNGSKIHFFGVSKFVRWRFYQKQVPVEWGQS
jgi:hypothetical protein